MYSTPRFKAQLPRLKALLIITLTALALAGSTLRYADRFERARLYTSSVAFNFLNWTLGALFEKAGQVGLGSYTYLTPAVQQDLVVAYIEQIAALQRQQAALEEGYGAPDGGRPPDDEGVLRAQVESLRPVVESILQHQVESVLAEMGLPSRGVVFPPVEFRSEEHTSELQSH